MIIYGVTDPICHDNAYPLPLGKCVFNSNCEEPSIEATQAEKRLAKQVNIKEKWVDMDNELKQQKTKNVFYLYDRITNELSCKP